jgi:mannose-6-phosphate isomerase-like protein (cupin superfamily)
MSLASPIEPIVEDVVQKEASDLPYYQGDKAIPGIKFRSAGKELGITAWGMNVLEIDSDCIGYPEHDHHLDGQEEVYVVLKGSATMSAGGKELFLRTGSLVRVGPDTRRKILPGPAGVTLLAIGGTPGQPYSPGKPSY